MLPSLTPVLASKFATLALNHVTREYPNKLEHVLTGPADLQSPRELHPIFYGSYDWHSCIHGYWMLARLLRREPDLPQADAIRALFDEHITEMNVAIEVSYMTPTHRATFERPYGWAWALMLSAELMQHHSHEGRRWAATLQPLATLITQKWLAFLPKATYPIRVGTHFNTAFALTLSLDYATRAGEDMLAHALRSSAGRWYLDDVDCQAWEPGSDEFLSSALMEAECMRRMLGEPSFSTWFDRFLPRLAARQPASLFAPAEVSDRSDGKIAHLDGLNLSRAWCWRHLASSLPTGDSRRLIIFDAAARHLDASLSHVAGDYMGEHWLATFALLALDE
jgi:Protein of unknown function (DUF2891)